MTSFRVAVDFGTSSTCTVMARGDGAPQVVVIDGAPLAPSAVYAAKDGSLFVGGEAERQAAVDPSRYEPHPKRRIDEGELLLGDSVIVVVDAIRAVLMRMVGEARRVGGGAPVDKLVLTHPADWGVVRTRLLRRAAHGLAGEILLVPEPVAAALFYVTGSGHGPIPDGTVLAVLDLGGGTVDASVVQRGAGGFRVLATRGDPSFGGSDIDQLLLDHVGQQVSSHDPQGWRDLVAGRELADRRRRRVLRADIRSAKETLSRHAYADVPLPSPFPDVHVTRDDLEGLIAAPLTRAVDLLTATINDATQRTGGARVQGIFLVGGSSRIPLVARLIHERTGTMPATLDQPETVVARGGLAILPPQAGGGQPAPSSRPVPVPVRPAALSGPVVAGTGQAARATSTAQVPAAPVPAGPVPVGVVRRPRWPFVLVGGVVLVAAVTLGVVLVATRATTISAYDYSFVLPDDWERSGGDSELMSVTLVRSDGPDSDLISVEQNDLGYDSDAQPDRAVQEIESQLQSTDPGEYSGFDQNASFAGRDVVYYRQNGAGQTVDWYVVFQARLQISVGCRHTQPTTDAVDEACREVVGSLEISP